MDNSGPAGRKNLPGGGAARAKARDAQPPVTAWAMGQRQWCDSPKGFGSSCRWCDYPGGIACNKVAHPTFGSIPKSSSHPREHAQLRAQAQPFALPCAAPLPGAALRTALPCLLRPRLNSRRPCGPDCVLLWRLARRLRLGVCRLHSYRIAGREKSHPRATWQGRFRLAMPALAGRSHGDSQIQERPL